MIKGLRTAIYPAPDLADPFGYVVGLIENPNFELSKVE